MQAYIVGQQLNSDCKIKCLQRSQQLLQRFFSRLNVVSVVCGLMTRKHLPLSIAYPTFVVRLLQVGHR